jgi:hypothetical protein
MKTPARVETYLRKRGSPDWVIQAGLEGLVERWEETASSMERGYRLGLDDFLNDMDVRQLVADCLPLAPGRERKNMKKRVILADTLIKKSLKPAASCIWGRTEAKRQGWTARRNWWYYRLPCRTGPEFVAPLEQDSD